VITFVLRDGFHSRVPVHVIGDEIEGLKKRNATPENPDGWTKPEDIVEHARPASSPLHPCFTWDLQQAAEKCWRDEARYLQRCYEVHIEQAPQQPPLVISPANVIVTRPDPDSEGERRPRSVSPNYAMSREDYATQVLRDTASLLNGIQNRLANLKGISPAIIKAIEVARTLIEKAAQKAAKPEKSKKQPATARAR
jgi:hypothetical protein